MMALDKSEFWIDLIAWKKPQFFFPAVHLSVCSERLPLPLNPGSKTEMETNQSKTMPRATETSFVKTSISSVLKVKVFKI
jgi:hypothetical protein